MGNINPPPSSSLLNSVMHTVTLILGMAPFQKMMAYCDLELVSTVHALHSGYVLIAVLSRTIVTKELKFFCAVSPKLRLESIGVF